jgi:hypothetical protein
MDRRYGEALQKGGTPVRVKDEGLATFLSFFPGVGMWYASDSLGDAVGYAASCVLLVPYAFGFTRACRALPARHS